MYTAEEAAAVNVLNAGVSSGGAGAGAAGFPVATRGDLGFVPGVDASVAVMPGP